MKQIHAIVDENWTKKKTGWKVQEKIKTAKLKKIIKHEKIYALERSPNIYLI